MTGIYKITCKVNNKVYIGQSVAIKRRWKEHLRLLKKNCHHNFKLQSDYNIYGQDNFNFQILELCQKKELDKKEQLYIKIFDSYNCGYNLTLGGRGVTKDRFGENNPMYGIKGDKAPRFKDYILQVDLRGNIINKYGSTLEAEQNVPSASHAHILGCLKVWSGDYFKSEGRRFTSGNFYWFYEQDFYKLQPYLDFSKKITSKDIIALQKVNRGALNSDI